jgi:hypothetical protein
MKKFSLLIEADTLDNLIKDLKSTLSHLSSPFPDTLPNPDFKLPKTARKRKTWTEFELNFLTDNYRKKNIKWLAGSLNRPPSQVYATLHKMYAKGLPRKNKRSRTLKPNCA